MNTGLFIAESLAKSKTPVFFYPGDDLAEMDFALEANKNQRVFMASDASVAHACNGFFQATKKLGVGFAGSGPGSTNLITGLATAAADRIPMLVIASTVAREKIGKGGFQDFDIFQAVNGFLPRSFFCRDGAQLGAFFRNAFENAFWNDSLPVLLSAPREAFGEEAAETELVRPARCVFSVKKISKEGNSVPCTELQQALAECGDLMDCFAVGNGLNRYAVLQSLAGKQVISSDRFGSMGFALPAAIGASLGLGRPITLFIGDGDLIMSLSELATLLRYQIPVKIVVFNNNNFLGGLNVYRKQRGQPAVLFDNPSFEMLSRAFRIDYRKVESFNLRQPLKKFLQKSGPGLIEFPCSLGELFGFVPKIPTIRNELINNAIRQEWNFVRP